MRTNDTVVADYLNLAGLVSCVSNPMTLVIYSVYTSHFGIGMACLEPQPRRSYLSKLYRAMAAPKNCNIGTTEETFRSLF